MTDPNVVAQAAIRRARFLRDEVHSGRVPASHLLGAEYLAQADRLLVLYPPELHTTDSTDETVDGFRRFLEDVTPDDFN